ncbi:hypothetical protein JYU34_008611 [Plutella xylostella]|uniref:dolichyl-phosphate-mannose--protein mannosyltransferase n=1 Tax=Plutella xylostella TaxID=51655 RepID=A0ABQ7QLI2_PLUXY|nr:hypothetical protein JYU34_008611 [Plutella xylostella]
MRWVTWASSLLAFLLYYNTMDAGFVYDDRRAILTNPDVTGHTPAEALFQNDFWGTPLADDGSHGSYRPLCVATYRLNYALSGLRPWSYHFLNVLLHCTATALVAITAKKLLPRACSRVGTAVTALTFAAHPIHTEAVAAIVGRADLAACNLFLLSFLVYNEHLRLRDISGKMKGNCLYRSDDFVRARSLSTGDQNFRLSCHGLVQQIFSNFRKLLKAGKMGPLRLISGDGLGYAVKTEGSSKGSESSVSVSEDSELLKWLSLSGALGLAGAATLCKEPAITVVPLCIVYDLLRGYRQNTVHHKNRWRSICLLSTGGVTMLYWRLRLAGAPPTFATADNPAARDPALLTRALTFAYLPIFNFYLLLFPFHLSFDWSMDAIPRITSLFDPRNIVTATFYTIVSKVAWRAIKHEFLRELSESKEIKVYKPRGSCKTKYKSNISRHPHRNLESADRRAYHAPHRDGGGKKLCPCTGCRHPVSEDHSGICRTMNNNNYMNHQSCICAVAVKAKQIKPQTVYNSSRVALLTFLAFMALPFVPASNFLFYVGFVVAERVLYLPSVGFCLLLGLGAGTMTKGWHRNELKSRMFLGSLLLCLLAMCGQTIKRNMDWRDEESLFKSALHINPPKAYGNLGSVLSAQGRTAEAEAAFRRALAHRPNMADVHYNLGILLQNQRRYEAAIKSFERAIYFRPSMALAYVNLGAALASDGRLSEAVSVLRAGTRVDGTRVRDRREHDSARVSALVQLAALHVQRSHWHKALAAYREALQIIPESEVPIVGWTRHSVLTMAGEIYAQLRHWAQAERSARQALAAAPRDAATHLAYAKLLARNASRSLEAEEWFKKALNLDPNNPEVRDQFGQFLRSQQRLSEAAEQLVAAAQLAPSNAARAAAAARALRDAQRCRSAERWYERAAVLSPEDAQSHSNLGAILHLNGKYAAAAAAYRRALQLLPGDEITLTNLKRVYTLMTNQHRT